MASCSAISWMGSQLVGLKSKPNVRPHCRIIIVSMTKENATMTSAWCLSCQKQDLTSFAWIAMSRLGKVILRFHRWVRKLVMTVLNVQFSSVPSLVEVMRLMGMASMLGRSAALKMSQTFQPSLTELRCGVRNICGVNRAIHARSGDNKIVLFLFVHRFHDCIKFLHDGWVVTVSPIGHRIFL